MLQLRVKPADDRGLQAVLDGEYALPPEFDPGPNPVILDIGANVGAFSLWALHTWSGAKIHAYEPVPENAGMLISNVVGLPVQVHKTAVWLADGTTRLFSPKEGYPPGSWSLKDTGEVDLAKGGVCKVMHAASLPPADIIKIDTEGCELDILRNYPHLAKAKAVVLEWHSAADRTAIRDLMTAHGFQTIEDKETFAGLRGVQKFIRAVSPTLFIAVLAGGGKTWSEFESCLSELQRVAPANGINLVISKNSGTGVDRARNMMVAAGLSVPNMTHFMFMDDDITFDPMWVVNMIKSNLDVVGAAYPRKEIDWGMIHKAVKDGVSVEDLPYYSTSFIFNFVVDSERNAIDYPGLGLFAEVEEIGTGFLMVKREVLEKFIAVYKDEISYITDYPPRNEVHHMVFACGTDPRCELELARTEVLTAAKRFEDDTAKMADAALKYQAALRKGKEAMGRYLTEDYRMCRMWRMLGGKNYMYLDASVGHLGTHKYEGQVKRQFKVKDGQ